MCEKCFKSLQRISSENLFNDFNRQYSHNGAIDGLFSLFYFEKDKAIHKIIHSFKYENRFQTGEYFGRYFSSQFSGKIIEEHIEIAVPVPLHPLKKAERGYNQSEYITKGICGESKLQYRRDLIKRVRYTKSQTRLSIEERKKNIRGAFAVNKGKAEVLKGKNILLFDDVITTGVTIAECAKVLKNAGAAKVFASSIALVPA